MTIMCLSILNWGGRKLKIYEKFSCDKSCNYSRSKDKIIDGIVYWTTGKQKFCGTFFFDEKYSVVNNKFRNESIL